MKTRNLVHHMNSENMSLLIEYRQGVYRGLYVNVPCGEGVIEEQAYRKVENY